MIKRVNIIGVLLLVVSVFAFGEPKLNKNSQYLRDNISGVYENIKAAAIEDWDTDHEMIVYTINKQSDKYYEAIAYIGLDIDILMDSMYKWSDNQEVFIEEYVIFIDLVYAEELDMDLVLESFLGMALCNIDWEMTEYEAKKQYTASLAY